MSELSEYLQGFNLKFEVRFLRANVEVKKFAHSYDRMQWTRFKWDVIINGEVFGFDTGACAAEHDFPTGHRPDPKKYMITSVLDDRGKWVWPELPELADVVSCLVSDSSAEKQSFSDWCKDLGWSDDSRKALDTYLACQDNAKRLRKALRGTDVDFNKLTELEH